MTATRVPTDRTPELAARSRLRAFVRAHHPDRGGDPAAFIEGLRALRAQLHASAAPPVSVHHRRDGPGVFVDWLVARWRARRRPPRVR